ncbi:MAG TPA: hypothetical protein VG346_02615 [Acidimicrobiales bacterium]|jgi:hypothetical protein|nr:hypothetical protein [Acidimicrobiales bacterium]
MRRGRWWTGLCIVGAGVVTLVPPGLGTASAGAASKIALCRAVKAEETSSDTVGLSLERAVASGNFVASKQAMLRAYGADERDVAAALGAAKAAPPAVRSAFTNLLSFVRRVRSDIESSKNFPGLLSSFERLAKDPRLVGDGATIEQWDSSACGTSNATTPSTR